MIYYEILTKTEKELWQIVEIAQQEGRIASVDALAEQMDVTRFIVKKRLALINSLWKKLFATEDLFEENTEITVSCQQMVAFQQELVKNSLHNRMLLDIFLDRLEVLDIPAKYQTSQAKAYRSRKEIQQVLATYGLSMKGNVLIGEERLIRNLFALVLQFRQLPPAALVDPETSQIITAVYQEISQQVGPLLPSQRRQLASIVFVYVTRILQGKYIATSFQPLDEVGAAKVTAQLQSFVRLPVKVAAAEAAYLQLVLYGYGFTTTLQGSEKTLDQRVASLEQQLWSVVTTSFDLEQTTAEEQTILQLKLRQLHWRHLLFPYEEPTFTFLERPAWSDYFADFFEIIQDLYLSSDFYGGEPIKVPQILPEHVYDYLFLLLAHEGDQKDEPPVFVCVDFFQSPPLSVMVKKLLSVAWFSCLVIQENVDETTDLYLSDRYDGELAIPQIIWNKPPDDEEQFDFWRKVAALSLKKSLLKV